jgi:hypothetical protein
MPVMNRWIAPALVAALAAGTARADDGATAGDGAVEAGRVTWSILGPAAAFHFSDTFAPRVAHPAWECQTAYFALDAAGAVTPLGATPLSVVGPSLPASGLGQQVSASTSGGVQHRTFVNVIAVPGGSTINAASACDNAGRIFSNAGWHQTNPALGVEASRRSGRHEDFAYATLVRDSLGNASAMAGAGLQWSIAHAGSAEVAAGVAGGLWYRTDVAGQYYERVVHHVEPILLPVLTVTETHSGVGSNIAFAPQIAHINNTPTLMFQLTYRLH